LLAQERTYTVHKATGFPLLLTKDSRTPQTFFQDCHSPAMFKYTDKQQLIALMYCLWHYNP